MGETLMLQIMVQNDFVCTHIFVHQIIVGDWGGYNTHVGSALVKAGDLVVTASSSGKWPFSRYEWTIALAII